MTFEWPSPIGSASSGPLAEPVRVQERLQRAPHEQRRELELGGLLGRVHDGRHAGATVPSYRNLGPHSPVSGGAQRSPCASRLSLILACSPARSRCPPPRPRPAPGHDLRGAARAARRRPRATRRSTRSAASASPRSASSSTGSSFAPGPNRKTKPQLRRVRPDAYPATRGHARRADRRRRGARDQGHRSRSPARCPRWATREQEGQPDRPEREGSSAQFVDRARRAATAPRSTRGRSGTSPTSRSSCMPQYRKRQAGTRRALPQALPRRLRRRSAASPANGDDTILIGETSPRGNENVVHPLAFLRGIAVPERQVQEDAVVRASCRPTATPTTPTRRAIGPRFVPADKNDVTIGVLVAARRPRSTAPAEAGALPRAPEDLPDRVRHPVRRRTRSPASRSRARPRTTRSPSTWPT